MAPLPSLALWSSPARRNRSPRFAYSASAARAPSAWMLCPAASRAWRAARRDRPHRSSPMSLFHSFRNAIKIYWEGYWASRMVRVERGLLAGNPQSSS